MDESPRLLEARRERAHYETRRFIPAVGLSALAVVLFMVGLTSGSPILPLAGGLIATLGGCVALLAPGFGAWQESVRILEAADAPAAEPASPTAELDGWVARLLPQLDPVDAAAVEAACARIRELRREADGARKALAGLDPSREGTRRLLAEIDACAAEADALADGLAGLGARWMAAQRERAPDAAQRLAVAAELAEVRSAAAQARAVQATRAGGTLPTRG